MIRWIKIVWHVARAPIMVVCAIPALGGVGAGCVEVLGLWADESYGVSVVLYSLVVVLGAVILSFVAFMGRQWWRESGSANLKEAREKYPAPPKVSPEPGDLEVVSAGDLEVSYEDC